jgi:hypothetical protein
MRTAIRLERRRHTSRARILFAPVGALLAQILERLASWLRS